MRERMRVRLQEDSSFYYYYLFTFFPNVFPVPNSVLIYLRITVVSRDAVILDTTNRWKQKKLYSNLNQDFAAMLSDVPSNSI